MTDAIGGLPAYDELTAQLALADIPASAAEVHGILTGLACVPGGASVDWLELLQTLGNGQSGAPDQTLAASLLAVSQSVSQSWQDKGLVLLLPDADAGTVARAAALADWARGFLLGVSAGNPDESSLSGDAREILEDMVELSRLEHDDDEAQQDLQGQEHALMELEEYLRVAAQLLREELQPETASH